VLAFGVVRAPDIHPKHPGDWNKGSRWEPDYDQHASTEGVVAHAKDSKIIGEVHSLVADEVTCRIVVVQGGSVK